MLPVLSPRAVEQFGGMEFGSGDFIADVRARSQVGALDLGSKFAEPSSTFRQESIAHPATVPAGICAHRRNEGR
jgi:hypothetical protein